MSKENPYTGIGYSSREDYLQSLAEEHDLALEAVTLTADLLGETEDFDGLVTTLEDEADTLRETFGDYGG